jgi:hypothetical protein
MDIIKCPKSAPYVTLTAIIGWSQYQSLVKKHLSLNIVDHVVLAYTSFRLIENSRYGGTGFAGMAYGGPGSVIQEPVTSSANSKSLTIVQLTVASELMSTGDCPLLGVSIILAMLKSNRVC